MVENEGQASKLRDLGFGTRVRAGAGERLLNRDGSFTVRRHGLPWRSVLSLYYSLLVLRWDVFLGLLGVAYFLTNSAFALLYLALGPQALAGAGDPTFTRAFFFSVQTISTIGYGHIVPFSAGANILAAVEAFVGMLAVALVTGIVFARFSKPVADIAFGRRAVIGPYRGIDAFEFRIANRRRNQIIEAHVRVFLSMVVQGADGPQRSFIDLPLERSQLAFFPLSWTVVHPIDGDSPLYGMTEEQVRNAGAEFLITLTGIDDAVSQGVHTRSSYTADEIVWGKNFANMYERSDAGTPMAIDLERIHDLK